MYVTLVWRRRRCSGNELTFDGSWSSPQSIDGGAELKSVTCPSVEFCAALDAQGTRSPTEVVVDHPREPRLQRLGDLLLLG
jgi:hypothetical protein